MLIPYGSAGLTLKRDLTGAEILESQIGTLKAADTEDSLVRAAMASPIGSLPLSQLAQRKQTATILLSDHTRPVPSRHIVPFLLEELRAGNPDIRITLLVATGCHRETTREELREKLGDDILQREHIVVHDCLDRASLVELGTLPSGAKLVVNRLAVETDLLLSEGFIEPHFFAGYSGGRKSVLPGICSQVTVMGNHCSAFIDSPYSRTGILEGNPIHRDMVAAAQMAGLRYIVNVVIDEEKHVAAAFAGDPFQAHEAGCRFLKDYCRVRPQRRGDIVITSNGGAPLDQNIYQCVKSLTAAEAAAAPGAVLIVCARCADGVGGESFYRALKECSGAQALLDEVLQIPMDQTVADQWQYQILARILVKHQVIFVSHPSLESTIRDMKMDFSSDLNDAVDRAYQLKGPDAHLVIIPNGVSVMVEEN
jgi:nickel-dependent lactate racemase